MEKVGPDNEMDNVKCARQSLRSYLKNQRAIAQCCQPCKAETSQVKATRLQLPLQEGVIGLPATARSLWLY